ncbi:hypothetical protein D3C77_511420 [compost metagenome]
MIEQDRAAGTLPEQVPRPWQIELARLLEQAVKHRLVFLELVDAGRRPAGQTVPRQVAGEHGEAHVQAPFDDMAVQPHVIVVAMHHQQAGVWLRRPPGLGHHVVVAHAKTPEAAVNVTPLWQVEAVIGLVVPGFGAQLGGGVQLAKLRAQQVGLDSLGHGRSVRRNSGRHKVLCGKPPQRRGMAAYSALWRGMAS